MTKNEINNIFSPWVATAGMGRTDLGPICVNPAASVWMRIQAGTPVRSGYMRTYNILTNARGVEIYAPDRWECTYISPWEPLSSCTTDILYIFTYPLHPDELNQPSEPPLKVTSSTSHIGCPRDWPVRSSAAPKLVTLKRKKRFVLADPVHCTPTYIHTYVVHGAIELGRD